METGIEGVEYRYNKGWKETDDRAFTFWVRPKYTNPIGINVAITGITLKLPTLRPKRARVKKQVIQTNNWKMRIQTQAASHILALRKGGANPTVHSIINDIHAWCVQNNVRAPRGGIPRPGYIRTHVLGGKHWAPPP